MPKQLPQFSGIEVISIGTTANDGTGDNLRTAFDKTNQNFNTLFGMTGLTDGFKFSKLYETPDTFVANALVAVNANADSLVYLTVSSSSDVSIENTGNTINFALAPTISSRLNFSNDIRFSGNVTLNNNGLKQVYINGPDLKLGTGTKVIQMATNAISSADADETGIRVGGGGAELLYRGVSDTWQINKTLVPDTTMTRDLGSQSFAWNNVYAETIHVANLNFLNTTVDTITANDRVLLPDGSAPMPSLAWKSDLGQDTGFYWGGDGYTSIANNGQYSGQFGPGGALTMTGSVGAPVGNFTNITANAANIASNLNTEIADRIAGNIALKAYVDSSEFLNFPPLAGTLNENYVPLYSDFKFSLGANGTYAFFITDNQGFQVVYFHASTPTGLTRPFRAYRFVPTDDFIYDTEPLTVGFAAAGEYVNAVFNVGTQFAYLNLHNPTSQTDRRVLATTNGSSKANTWGYYADVTSITSGAYNIFLLQDDGGDRILRTSMSSSSITLDVYDNTLSLLRTQQLFSSSEVSSVDHTGSGRTVGDANLPFGYNPFGTAFAFTWNKFTETLLMKAVGYYVWQQSGQNNGQGFGTTISWNIPRTWITGGTGTPTNLIPLNASGYRYHKLPDTTWNSATGGMGDGYGDSGQGPSVTTDEYGKAVHMGIVGTWSTTGFSIYSFPYNYTQNFGSVQATYEHDVAIPDASAWSKQTFASYGQIIDHNVLFYGYSNQYGGQSISANFSTTEFVNNALKLDISTSGPENTSVYFPSNSNAYGTTSVSGTALAYSATPGRMLYIITVVNNARVYTASGFTLPAIPGTIGSVSGLNYQGPTVYSGDSGNKQFWCIVSDSTGQFYIAKYSNGGWNDTYGPFVSSQIQAAASARGDTNNSWGSGNGAACLTANGRFLSYISMGVPGGANFYILEFNTNTNTMTVHGWNQFDRISASPYGGISPYYGLSFGFSSSFGYYCMVTAGSQTSILISSSKDITGVGSEHTEDEWFANNSGRYNMNISAQSTVGLSIYLKSFPLFIGGYHCEIPNLNLTLPANATSYIYATLPDSNRSDLAISYGSDFIPNGFNRVTLGYATTNAQNVVSSTSYRIGNDIVSITALKSIISGCNSFADFKTAILAL